MLSPAVRFIIGAINTGVAAFAALLPNLTDVPVWVGVVVVVASAVLNFLLVPTQLGGTQEGLANPRLHTPPPADVTP